MFRNFFKSTLRNLSKYKIYSLINVFGLTLGITSCLVIFLVVRYELGYDSFHSKADRIYRVTLNAIDFNPCVSMAIAAPMRNDFPELEKVSQLWYRQEGLLSVGNKKFKEKGGAFADEYFPSVFDYKWLKGNYKSALKEPNSIVLTESLARKYFGKTDAIGQTINFENQYNLKVTGIIQDLPGNTNLPLRYMVSLETIRKDISGLMNSFWAIPWGSFTYIVTPPGYDITRMQNKIHGFLEKNWGKELAEGTRLPLQPLKDIHFDPRYLNNTISYTTSRETYYVLSAVALLIILIACINFINLATAQSIHRTREVGVRKVLGSSRSQLLAQFLGETSIMVFIALVLGLFLTTALLPYLSDWLDIKLNINPLMQPPIFTAIILSALMVVVLAGLYPAFIQSSFKVAESLKNSQAFSFRKLNLRKTLVVIQFSISQIMIIGTLIVAYQMDFFQNQDLGFEKEAIVSIGIPNQQKSALLKQELEKIPGVKDLSLSSGAPAVNNSFTSFISPEAGLMKDDVTELKFIDENFIDMFQLTMLAGNKILPSNTSPGDTVFNVIANETLIHKLGIQDPVQALGKNIIANGNWYCTITGVIKDFQSESKHKKIRPCIMIYRPDEFYMASVKLRPNGINQSLSAIDKSWSALFPENVFSYEFLDDHIAAWYRQEQKEYTAFKLFAGIAILIGCLGLYGLVAFAAAQRTKEVGIRKVLGASLSNIVVLLSKEFVPLIVLAFLIAAPLAYLVMNNWLQGFAYQIKIGAGIFVVAIIGSFLIAALTIAYQVLKAGLANPVGALRSE